MLFFLAQVAFLVLWACWPAAPLLLVFLPTILFVAMWVLIFTVVILTATIAMLITGR